LSPRGQAPAPSTCRLSVLGTRIFHLSTLALRIREASMGIALTCEVPSSWP